jgi:hypothetical protein
MSSWNFDIVPGATAALRGLTSGKAQRASALTACVRDAVRIVSVPDVSRGYHLYRQLSLTRCGRECRVIATANSALILGEAGHALRAPRAESCAAQAGKYASANRCKANTILLGNLFGENINADNSRHFYITPQFR